MGIGAEYRLLAKGTARGSLLASLAMTRVLRLSLLCAAALSMTAATPMAAQGGEGFRYRALASLIRAELFDPAEWAELFQASGARYLVLTSKHHDGFALWASAHAGVSRGFPWSAANVGPNELPRDWAWTFRVDCRRDPAGEREASPTPGRPNR